MNQLVFIKNFIIEKKFTKYNINIISIKTESAIETFELNDYKKTNFYIY